MATNYTITNHYNLKNENYSNATRPTDDTGSPLLTWGDLLLAVDIIRYNREDPDLKPFAGWYSNISYTTTLGTNKSINDYELGNADLKGFVDGGRTSPRHCVCFPILLYDFLRFFHLIINMTTEESVCSALLITGSTTYDKKGRLQHNYKQMIQRYYISRPVLIYSLEDFANLFNMLLTDKRTSGDLDKQYSTIIKNTETQRVNI